MITYKDALTCVLYDSSAAEHMNIFSPSSCADVADFFGCTRTNITSYLPYLDTLGEVDILYYYYDEYDNMNGSLYDGVEWLKCDFRLIDSNGSPVSCFILKKEDSNE